LRFKVRVFVNRVPGDYNQKDYSASSDNRVKVRAFVNRVPGDYNQTDYSGASSDNRGVS
jgi:hypothetical protein